MRLPEIPPSVPGFTSSKSNLLNSATWLPAGSLLPLGRLLSGIVVAVSRSRADPIRLGSNVGALEESDGWEADDAASEGPAATGDALRLRCVGIVTGFDLGLPDVEVFLGELDRVRGGDGPASKAAAWLDSRLLDNKLTFSFRSIDCRLAVDNGTNDRGTIILNVGVDFTSSAIAVVGQKREHERQRPA